MLAITLSEIFQTDVGEVSDGCGGMNAICSRPELADDVISGTDVNTFRHYAYVNLGFLRKSISAIYVMRR